MTDPEILLRSELTSGQDVHGLRTSGLGKGAEFLEYHLEPAGPRGRS